MCPLLELHSSGDEPREPPPWARYLDVGRSEGGASVSMFILWPSDLLYSAHAQVAGRRSRLRVHGDISWALWPSALHTMTAVEAV